MYFNEGTEIKKVIVQNPKKKSILCFDKILCVLMCIWFIWPYFFIRTRTIFFVICFLLWIFCVAPNWKVQKKSKDLLYLILFFSSFFPYIALNSFKYGAFGGWNAFFGFFRSFASAILADYYIFQKRDKYFLKRLIVLCVFFHTIGVMQTLLGHLVFPWPSRALTNATTASNIRELYTLYGIGGVGYIYSLSIASMLIVFLFIKGRTMNKMLLLSLLILYSVTLFQASFTISIILLIFGVFLMIIIERPIFYIYLCILLAIFLGCILYSLDIFSENITWHSNIYSKFIDLYEFWLYGNKGLTSGRIDLYYQSLFIFFKEPFLGAVYGPFGNTSRIVGEHSGFLDLLAFYGLYSFIPLALFVYYNFKKTYVFFGYADKSLIILIYIIFFLMSLLNPIHIAYHIGFFVLFIVPAVLCIYPEAVKEK